MPAKKRKEEHVGTVEHYYPKAKAAAVRLDKDLKVGQTIHVVGHSDDVTRKVSSMELDHERVEEGHAGESVGVGMPERVHENSEVLRIPPGAAKGVDRKPVSKPRQTVGNPTAGKGAKSKDRASRRPARSAAKRTAGARAARSTAPRRSSSPRAPPGSRGRRRTKR